MAFPPRAPRGAFNPRFKKEQQQEHKTNHMIRVPKVRLVGDNVEIGVYDTAVAQKLAQDQGLDLVEISPQADPPVCKIIDYNKFIYEQKKKQKELKSKAAKSIVKEIRFGPNTDEHDIEFKVKHAEKFLEEGAKVRAFVLFRGRAIVYKERGEILLLQFAQRLQDVGKVEQLPKLEGKKMTILLTPKGKNK